MGGLRGRPWRPAARRWRYGGRRSSRSSRLGSIRRGGWRRPGGVMGEHCREQRRAHTMRSDYINNCSYTVLIMKK